MKRLYEHSEETDEDRACHFMFMPEVELIQYIREEQEKRFQRERERGCL